MTSLIQNWNKQYNDFSKLQHVYGILAISILVIAGLISLVNNSLGQSILFISVMLSFAFVANGMLWALLNTFVLRRFLQTKPKNKK